MSSIDNVVTVSITKGSKAVPLPGFGIPAILGPSNRWVDLYRIYTNSAALLADGFLTSDPEYKHAVALMSQAQKPTRFIVGKYSAPVQQIDTVFPTAVNATHYIVTIDGVPYDYLSDSDATVSEIVAGLLALINADSGAPCIASGTGNLILTAKVAGTGFTTTLNANMTIAHTLPNHTVVMDVQALQASNDSWYALILTSKLSADILQVAAYIETQLKLFIAASSEAAILTSSTGDLASLLKGFNYERTALIYSADPSLGPDAAWVGEMVPQTPGAATWKFKTLVGIAVDNLTESQINFAQGKNCNLYLDIGGVGITTEGVVSSGEFIDVTLFIDWLTSTMKVNVFSPLVNLPKVPYTNKGIAAIENPVRQTLRQGIDNGGLSDDPAPVVTVPDAADVPQADKTSRTLNNVVFTATLAGAIHKVNIQGFVSV